MVLPLALALSALQVATGAGGDPASGCGLLGPGSEQATTASCTACHAQSRVHPVDVDYRAAAGRDRSRFADADAVVRAGVLLPDGQIRCVTCHDRASPWRYRLALPPGATPMPSVEVMQSRSAEFPELRPRASAPLPRGSDVSPTPLCLACHVF